MKHLKTLALFFTFLSLLAFFPAVFVKAGDSSVPLELENPLGEDTTFCTIIKRVAGFMIWAAAPIVGALIFYGAYQIMFSKGDPQAVATGKNTILYTVIAYAIILLGWSVVGIIQEILGAKVQLC
jgi:hypothetical protein